MTDKRHKLDDSIAQKKILQGDFSSQYSTKGISTALFCSGFGAYHSPNNSAKPTDYVTLSWGRILELLASPQNVEKCNSQWALFSEHQSRVNSDQIQQGQFWALWADIDDTQGVAFKETVSRAMGVFPAFLAYTSRGATESNQKARLIVPLEAPVPGNQFVILQKILNDKLAAVGIIPDRATERANQICYLPNKGEFYQYHHQAGLLLQPPIDWDSDITAENELLAGRQVAQNTAMQAAKLKACQRMAAGVKSPLDAFNAEYRIPMLFDQYGYQRRGNRWVSPCSVSGIAGVVLTANGTKWLSSHDSDSSIGKQAATGTLGDAFDLFCHYEHAGNRNAALTAAGAMFTTKDGLTISKANQREYTRSTVVEFPIHPATPPQVPEYQEPEPPVPAHGQFSLKVHSGSEMALGAKPPAYVIKDVLELDCHGILGGNSMTYKTFIALAMAHSITTGSPFMGHPVRKQGKVLYICGEGAGGISRRIRAIERLCGSTNGLLKVIPGGLSINNMIHLAELRHVIEAERPVLVIFDTFASLAGGVDENSPSEVGPLLGKIKETCRAGGSSSLIIHHFGKDASKGFRGASNFTNDVDYAFMVQRSAAKPRAVTMTSHKAKDGDAFKPISILAEIVKLGIYDADNEESTSLVAVMDESPQATDDDSPGRTNEDRALTCLAMVYQRQVDTLAEGGLRGNPTVTRQDWHKAISQAGVKEPRVYIKRLELKSKIEVLSGGEYRPKF